MAKATAQPVAATKKTGIKGCISALFAATESACRTLQTTTEAVEGGVINVSATAKLGWTKVVHNPLETFKWEE